jgi:tetratricopeptide (TPR) repeat protein
MIIFTDFSKQKKATKSRLKKLALPIFSISLLLLTSLPSLAQEAEELVEKANILGCATSGNYKKAIKLYSKAISINPKEARYYFRRMSCYRSAKEYTLEAADSRTAAKIEPNSILGHYIRSSTNFWNAGNFKDVVRDQTIVIDLDKNNSLAYFIRASAYEEMNMDIDAATDYKHWLDIHEKSERTLISDNTKTITVYDHLAKIRWRQGDYSEALKDFACLVSLETKEHFMEVLIAVLFLFATGVSILDIAKKMTKNLTSLLARTD